MMLRASIESAGGKVDLRSLTDGSLANASGIPGAEALIAWVEATRSALVDPLANDDHTEAIAAARSRVRSELGAAAMVDAAAVIGNFERMVRIADATGIPLDTPVNVATESIRAELGIDAFESSEQTPPIRGWQRFIGRLATPLIWFGLRRRSAR